MQLRELEVRNWRGLTQTVGPFSESLNLICGANESGKSRLVQALRFALFESCQGRAAYKQALQSWNTPEPPIVRLVIEVGGITYTLKKQFLTKPHTELAGGGKTLRDEEAESRLRELIGARAGGRTEIGVDDMGIWPLLLVRQGESRTIASALLNTDSHSRLQEALAEEIGAATISPAGGQLLERVDEEWSRYYTPTGRENTILTGARTRVERAEQALANAKAAHAEQERTAAALAQARVDLEGFEPRIKQMSEDLQKARTLAEAARSAEGRVKERQIAVQLTQERFQQADQARHERTRQEKRIADMTSEQDRQQAAMQQFDQHREALEDLHHQAVSHSGESDERLRDARKALEQARRAHHARDLDERGRQLDGQIAKLDVNEQAQAQARARRAALPIIAKNTLQQLRDIEREAAQLRAQLQGAALQVGIRAHQPISINGQSVPAGGTVTVAVLDGGPIRIDGVADIEVQGRLGSIDKLRRRSEQADQELAEALQQAGVPSVAAATEAFDAYARATNELEALEREAELISEKPVAELREQRQRLTGERQALGATDGAPDLDAAQLQVIEAEGAREAAREARAQAERGLAQHREETIRVREQLKLLTEQLEAAQAQLQQMPTTAALDEAVQARQQERASAQLALEEAERLYAQVGGAKAPEDASRLERAVEKLVRAKAEAKSNLDQLQGSLRTLVAGGSYETVSDAAGELELAQTALARLLRGAAAASRLREVLRAKHQHVVEQLTAPVVARIKPYLEDIFPGSAPDAGENFSIRGLQTGNTPEDFDSLSGGAQEQFSLMTRIGLAEVLAGDDRLPLILDDSLVNSDAERIKLVHRALDRASRNLQVIVFTCHEPLFDALGADYQFRLPGPQRRG